MRKYLKRSSLISLVILLTILLSACHNPKSKTVKHEPKKNEIVKAEKSKEVTFYEVSEEERAYLSNRFSNLRAVNPETIGYIYAPGTHIDEPIVQTTDNATYLDKTFEGQIQPFLGAVFMDTANKKDFSDRLTWLFGHARGSLVPDSRMFNDVNYYNDQAFFDEHPYVVIETPERKYYYEAVFLIIVPEDTPLYRTSFSNDREFEEQLNSVRNHAQVRNQAIKINPKDRYLVLSTCREEDDTMRANLYLRQVPDVELTAFLERHGDKLSYVPTR